MPITIEYEEDFSTDRAATIPAHPTTHAALVGNTRYSNPGTATVSGGELHPSNNMLVMDAIASRARLAGRIMYWRLHTTSSTWGTNSSQAWHVTFAESPAVNWWATGFNGDPGAYMHHEGSFRSIGSKHDGGAYSQSVNNYQQTGIIASSTNYETVCVDRGTGSFWLIRVNGGDWQIKFLESLSDLPIKQGWRFTGSSIASQVAGEHMATYQSGWTPTPLVQQSFASVVSPSDGDGQPETGGDGVEAVTSGSVQIASSELSMSADGTGTVVFPAGESDVSIHLRATPKNGSPVAVIFRWQDANNYLRFQFNSSTDTISLIERVAGSDTTLSSIVTNPSLDNWDLPETEQEIQVHCLGSLVRCTMTPGATHVSFLQATTTRFQTATSHGVRVEKGSGVDSSSVRKFVVFANVQDVPTPWTTVPVFMHHYRQQGIC